MSLETATYIGDLVATNPVGATDFVSQGDDHIRLLKAVLLASLPGVTGAVTSTHTELNYLDGATGVTGTGNTVRSASPTFTGTAVFENVRAGDGTAAAPSIHFASDADNGMYLPAANTLGFATAGTLRLTLTGSLFKCESNVFEVAHATPVYRWSETDQATDEKNWIAGPSAKGWRLATTTDAAPGTAVVNAIRVLRGTGTAVSGIELNAAVDLNGNLDVSGTATIGGALTTPNTSASEVGFKGAPQNAQNGNYTLVLTDAGKTIYKASGGAGETITIPANGTVAFPVGSIVRVVNNGGGELAIAITDDTLSLAGAGTTGSRALADHGVAVLEKVATTEWFISGVGLS